MRLTKMSYITTLTALIDRFNTMIELRKIVMAANHTGKAMKIMASECASLLSETRSLDAIWM